MRTTESDLWALAWDANRGFDWPLPPPEVREIVKSTLRRRKEWRGRGWHSDAFRKRQAARGRRGGRRSGKARAEKAARAAQAARELRDGGVIVREIADALGVSRATVYNYLARVSNEPYAR